MRSTEPLDHAAALPISAAFLLARLGEAAASLYRESFKDTGLKPPHVVTLTALAGEPVSQQALSELTEIDAVKLVGVLNDLESGGLVQRRRDTIDRRRHIVAITSAGRERLEVVQRATAVVEERLFGGLTNEQRQQLGTLLGLVAETSRLGQGCTEDAPAATGCPPQSEPPAADGCC